MLAQPFVQFAVKSPFHGRHAAPLRLVEECLGTRMPSWASVDTASSSQFSVSLQHLHDIPARSLHGIRIGLFKRQRLLRIAKPAWPDARRWGFRSWRLWLAGQRCTTTSSKWQHALRKRRGLVVAQEAPNSSHERSRHCETERSRTRVAESALPMAATQTAQSNPSTLQEIKVTALIGLQNRLMVQS